MYYDSVRRKTKSERQHETSLMKKCGCGNVVGLGKLRCGRCETNYQEAAMNEKIQQVIDWYEQSKESVQ